ncbi:MAG: YfiR family protein [Salinivirgaceae bacterium]|nr:YfiR family protein [Salinivirgaceae bacterium]
MKSIKNTMIAFVTAVLSLAATGAHAQYSEYEVKAAYIFNFAKFIEWPANYIEGDTLYLCVYKNDPFGIILEKTMIGRKANGKDWKIKRISNLAETDNCHMLILSGIKLHEAMQVVKTIGEKPIVTIGDEMNNFCQIGGVINFLPQFSERQFEINKDVANDIGIKISPKLLLLAKIISTKEDEF